MLTLSGKGALLVGTRRVGATIAHRLAAEGINLSIVYRSSKRDAEELTKSLASKVERVCLIQGDVGVEEDVQRMVSESVDRLGDLSFVVSLASGFPRTPYDSLDGAAWDESISTAKGAYLLTLYASRKMMENPGPTRGHVLLFGDWAADTTPYAGYLPYLTSKAAVGFMTRAFAVELAPHGVLVNAIAPGPTMRPPDIEEADWQTNVVARAPLRRESSADEMAELIVTLLKSETITGELIRVDSGRHLAGPSPAG